MHTQTRLVNLTSLLLRHPAPLSKKYNLHQLSLELPASHLVRWQPPTHNRTQKLFELESNISTVCKSKKSDMGWNLRQWIQQT